MDDQHTRWVARVIPLPGQSVDTLLHMSLGLDVWERHPHMLVVAATEEKLSALERGQLAQVERLYTTAEYEARVKRRNDS
jgi:hypothetical protein